MFTVHLFEAGPADKKTSERLNVPIYVIYKTEGITKCNP